VYGIWKWTINAETDFVRLGTIAKIQITYRAVDFLKHNLYQNI